MQTIKWVVILNLLLTSIGITIAAPVTETPHLTQARVQAVTDARNGHLVRGITALKKLHHTNPGDPLITADLIVLMRRAGQNAQIATLTKQTISRTIPDYAILDWVRALRDQKKFVQARSILYSRLTKLGPKADILYGMISVEAGLTHPAIAALPPINTKGLDATDLADMAYVYRKAGDPTHALTLAYRAISLAPQNPHAQRELVFALSDSGAANLAWKKAQEHPNLFKIDALHRLRADATTVKTRNAVQERKRLDNRFQYAERDIPLEQALAELKENQRIFSKDKERELRTRYDQIFVLRTLDMMKEAINTYEALPQKPVTASQSTLSTIPSYVRQAAADAYLYLKHPRQAADLYKQLIKENPKADVNLFIALYFAYLDNEQYDHAEKILTNIHRITPTWSTRQKTAGKIENWERLDVDQLWAMDAAYRNHEDAAYARIKILVDHAPRNTGLLNAKATIERWRGWPAKSQKTTLLANAYAPETKDTQINLADNARDLEHFQEWGRKILALAQAFPTDTSIQKSLAQWRDRKRPSISSEYTTGHSRGNGTLSNPVAGNRDQEWQTRINSAWLDNGWRAYIDQHYIWSSFTDSSERYNRYGVGAEWRGDRKHAWVSINNDQLTGRHVGVEAGWTQWLNDHWQYGVSGNTYSLSTPLRAKQVDLSGKSLNAKLNWRQDETRDAYAALSVLAITDGNKRTDFAAGMSQRLFSNPHHITTGGLDVFAEHNSRPGGNYFNPANSESVSMRLEHKWITWRDYDRSFTQYAKVSAGYGWQDGYGGAPMTDLFYEHIWKLNRTWDLHYGVGWGSNVYDGGREQRIYGVVGFGGVF
ncbi:poly-beta-1,6 N-acetyl-D-glucosamine export porin PgaA [Halothiobacillus sp.]|uniref:poly-beta-1,6 N-acetyl-D-glucosamine export porin PgaA n=1 Tax=Halothiobacillus sp. TaxID=1891311 RepID=UPI002AD4E609|nr:poly-beta-1,6 N-acetyl-D-glucosamine export porin PgaA [Halothiobacillus sp.]